MGDIHSPAAPSSSTRKRQAAASPTWMNNYSHSTPSVVQDGASRDTALCIPDDDLERLVGTPVKALKRPRNNNEGQDSAREKRLRRYRPKPPTSFADIYDRATTQRFYLLTRTRCGTESCPEEMIELTGSTGNVYTVCIAQQPTCSCPHALAGNQCKHGIFVLSCVLRAKYEYIYQLALLTSELRDIFANAPRLADGSPRQSPSYEMSRGRKAVEGDCPICFEEMGEGAAKESIVWCRAACGQNIHEQCFELWAAMKRQSADARSKATCPYCRSQWLGDDDMVRKIEAVGRVNEEGYVNVADQLGISTHRGTSTYSQWWPGHPDSYRRRSYW